METTAIEMFLQSVLSPGAAPPAGGDRGKHQVMLVGVATHRSVGRTMVAARAAVRSLGARGGDQARGCVPPYTLRRRSLLTCVYTCVVARLAWPKSSWTTRRSAPPSSRWVA
jgi:hypothetical protein